MFASDKHWYNRTALKHIVKISQKRLDLSDRREAQQTANKKPKDTHVLVLRNYAQLL